MKPISSKLNEQRKEKYKKRKRKARNQLLKVFSNGKNGCVSLDTVFIGYSRWSCNINLVPASRMPLQHTFQPFLSLLFCVVVAASLFTRNTRRVSAVLSLFIEVKMFSEPWLSSFSKHNYCARCLHCSSSQSIIPFSGIFFFLSTQQKNREGRETAEQEMEPFTVRQIRSPLNKQTPIRQHSPRLEGSPCPENFNWIPKVFQTFSHFIAFRQSQCFARSMKSQWCMKLLYKLTIRGEKYCFLLKRCVSLAIFCKITDFCLFKKKKKKNQAVGFPFWNNPS